MIGGREGEGGGETLGRGASEDGLPTVTGGVDVPVHEASRTATQSAEAER
jgi:hypothetical protein